MTPVEIVLLFIIGFLFGLLLLGFALHKKKLMKAFESAQSKSQKIIEQTHKDADRVIRSALQESKEESSKRRRAFEEQIRKKKSELNVEEQKHKEKESEIKATQKELDSKEKKLRDLEQKLIDDEKDSLRLKAEYELSIEKNQKTLEKIAKMSVSEAKRRLMDILEESARKECYPEVKKIEQEAYRKASQKAKKIISLAIQKIAGNYVNDTSITVVQLPTDEMKGRIIGREGRNIRMIEQSVGVDLIIDDTPEAVIISSFNPIRREIAKLSLEKLIADGRIHPARIEETVSRVEAEMDVTIKEFGDQASFDIGVTDLHPHLVSLLGKLRFRSVGIQSVLQHSVETANICGMIAGELGVNVSKAKRAGLLHDIGKAVDQDTEGHHAAVGADICRQYGEEEDIVNAVALHHSDNLKDASILAVILSSANNLSTHRPGARKELLASYIKRLERMEEIILDFPHVKKVFVLQSGREIRVIVEPNKVTDYALKELIDNVAKKLRQELTFPGQVRITAIKESRQIEYAS